LENRKIAVRVVWKIHPRTRPAECVGGLISQRFPRSTGWPPLLTEVRFCVSCVPPAKGVTPVEPFSQDNSHGHNNTGDGLITCAADWLPLSQLAAQHVMRGFCPRIIHIKPICLGSSPKIPPSKQPGPTIIHLSSASCFGDERRGAELSHSGRKACAPHDLPHSSYHRERRLSVF